MRQWNETMIVLLRVQGRTLCVSA